jgi:ferredoxin-nitrate reductase
MKIDRVADPWGPRTPFGPGDPWPVRVDQYLDPDVSPEAVDRWVQTATVLTSNGDALDLAVKDGRIVGVRGRATDRINHGRVDPKDLYAWQAIQSPDRLTVPLVRGSAGLEEADWETAMNLIAERSRSLLAEKGPLSIGFYTSGQLFLEEYYTLAVIGKAGIGTPHMDGNTRLCTATAASALKASFGTDGQPGSYTDFDRADTICLYGHNIAETQSVLWARILDRRRGPNPPKLIVVDPRPTPAACEADIHLAVRNGTNLALMNALENELIQNGSVDLDWIGNHTLGFEKLRTIVAAWTPERAAEICHVPAEQIREAARLIGASQRLVSTVLQGFYQSMLATAASVQVNNIHLLRGMIGQPGCSVFQMNGQPTAQNTRETGADGDLPGFRNWDNPTHIKELADLWRVDPIVIPHWAPPTHAMQIWRYAEQGSIKLLWVSGTNPAVSLPELARIRQICAKEGLFLVVQDAYLTETAQLADVVLPAAIWAEKTGTFTNADRTVHLSEKAVEPPGQARSDLDIWLDYARRMDFRNKDGEPLITWHDAETAFEAWKQCSRGRPCDYSSMTYDKLREGGIQWPCTADAPQGTERLYTNGHFNTDSEYCETFGQDLETGAENEPMEYKAKNPKGRAFLHGAEYSPPAEEPSADYPYSFTTGRTIFHWHTRTKTGRTPQLHAAAPAVWVELSGEDAGKAGVKEGDWVRVESPRGYLDAPVRISGIAPGIVFAPFHYGYFDQSEGDRPDSHPSAANELTLTEWDPVSKQPYYKIGAARLTRIAESGGHASPAPTNTASAPAGGASAEPTAGGEAAEAESTGREG